MATNTSTNYLEERLLANTDSLVFARLADYYLNNDEIDQAIETCSRGLKLHPYNATGRLVLGRCYMKQERWAEAVEVFTEVCRLDPRNLMAIKLLGDLFTRQGLSAQAGDLYQLVAALDPFDRIMADVAAQAIGSGKIELFDILADGAAGVKAGASTVDIPTEASGEEDSAAASSAIPETAEATSDESVDSPAMETFDTMETADEVEGVDAGSATMSGESLELAEESTVSPLDGESGEADSEDRAETAPTKSSGIPDGLEISSRFDSLFGEGTPASGKTAAPLSIDMPGEEPPVVNDRETLAQSVIEDAAPENPLGEGIDDETSSPAFFPDEQNSDTERLILEDALLPTAAQDGDISESTADAGLDRIDIVTPTLAEIYFKQGQLHHALAMYRRLLEKDPGNDHLLQSIQAVNAAIASGGEGIPMMGQERGKASRKIIEEEAGTTPGPEEPRVSEPAHAAKPKGKIKFKWIKRPHDER